MIVGPARTEIRGGTIFLKHENGGRKIESKS
jgi:hypothetical protein